MELARLTLRDNALNKRYAMRFIEPLRQDIAHGDTSRASETLREIFADVKRLAAPCTHDGHLFCPSPPRMLKAPYARPEAPHPDRRIPSDSTP